MKNTIKQLLIFCLFLISPLSGQSGSQQQYLDCPVESSVLIGTVTDLDNEQPVGFVNILLTEANRSITSDASGNFKLTELRRGNFTLKTFRIGYKNITRTVTLMHNDTTRIYITLDRTPLLMQDIMIVASGNKNDNSISQTPIILSDKKLHANLGKTIAETVDYEPGISQRSMGPAPARPVLRGLGGSRLLLLEDNESTGDLSATSADHAVVIEPMTAERIEVIRGPEALTFGSNTLGGVINVVRGSIPTTRVEHITGSLSLNSETVNRGYAGGSELTLPLGPLTLRMDGSTRNASDIQTPVGKLLNTNIQTHNTSLGIALIRNWGRIGFAAGDYESNYGIPPDPSGGHPKGVDINMDRKHTDSRIELFPSQSWLKKLNFNHTWSRYYHEENEASGDLGMNYGVIEHHFSGEMGLNSFKSFQNGKLGMKSGYRDYATGGLTFTPAVKEYSQAVYYYQEAYWGPLLLHGALRYDYKSIQPENEFKSVTVGSVRKRSFQDYSASFSAHYQWESWTIGNTITRTFMAPGVEELFSEGPHLAAYSYQVGNAELGAETGLGVEFFANKNSRYGSLYLAVYQNNIDNYLIPVNTGEKSWRRADLYIYRYLGESVVMRGSELTINSELFRYFSINSSISYVWGELSDQNLPIPRIPPLEGKLALNYRKNNFTLGTVIRAADGQYRTGEFEDPTTEYITFDIMAQHLMSGSGMLHSISASIHNLSNVKYRKHLNRVKEIMPEPGRNFRLLYKIFF